jgi:hypothetical protein
MITGSGFLISSSDDSSSSSSDDDSVVESESLSVGWRAESSIFGGSVFGGATAGGDGSFSF